MRQVTSSRAAREGQLLRRRRCHPQLAHAHGLGDADLRALGHDDGERNDGAARPARQRVDVDRKPRRQQRQLHRHRRQTFPGELPEVGEEAAGEDTGARQAAVVEDELARAPQRRLVGVMSDQLEREVGLDGVVQVPRAAVVQRPAAVGGLRGQQVIGHAPFDGLRAPPHEAVEEDVLGVHRDVGLERRVPESLRTLRGQKVVAAAPNRRVEAAAQLFTRQRRGPSLLAAVCVIPSIYSSSSVAGRCRCRRPASRRAQNAAIWRSRSSGQRQITAPPPPPPVSFAPRAPAAARQRHHAFELGGRYPERVQQAVVVVHDQAELGQVAGGDGGLGIGHQPVDLVEELLVPPRSSSQSPAQRADDAARSTAARARARSPAATIAARRAVARARRHRRGGTRSGRRRRRRCCRCPTVCRERWSRSRTPARSPRRR